MLTKDEAEKKMKGSIEHFENELKNIRTGRANPAMLDPVKVDVYGTQMRIIDIAQMSVPEPMQILITPFDPQNSAAIGKGIEKANIGLSPIVEGNCVRINIPQMDGDTREKMKKTVRDLCEQTKISIRQSRKEANDYIKSNNDLSKDDKIHEEKKIQDLTDKYCKVADDLSDQKEKEISTI